MFPDTDVDAALSNAFHVVNAEPDIYAEEQFIFTPSLVEQNTELTLFADNTGVNAASQVVVDGQVIVSGVAVFVTLIDQVDPATIFVMAKVILPLAVP